VPTSDLTQVAWLSPELYPDEAFPSGRYVEVLESGKFGGLVQWVNDSPGDPVDSSGHFIRYEGKKADYHFRVWPDGTPDRGQPYTQEDEA
jgi:hypothetical protein